MGAKPKAKSQKPEARSQTPEAKSQKPNSRKAKAKPHGSKQETGPLKTGHISMTLHLDLPALEGRGPHSNLFPKTRLPGTLFACSLVGTTPSSVGRTHETVGKQGPKI